MPNSRPVLRWRPVAPIEVGRRSLPWLAALCLFLCVAPAFAVDLVAIPPLQARVTDLTGTLSKENVATLEGSLETLQRTKGSEVVILILPTTQPESIEQFGIRLAGVWKIGRKGVNDGVIVVVAKEDRHMRIEVGYGLEGAIPDAIAKRIVSDIMAPRFKRGDFFGGLQDAVAAISAVIDKEPLPEPKAEPARATGDFSRTSGDWLFWAFGLIALAGVAHRLLGMAGSGLAAILGAVLGWFVFGSLLIAVIAAVIVFFGSFMRGGGYYGGGIGGGGFGGRGGGGGFSGGGGSFGGGGASGSW